MSAPEHLVFITGRMAKARLEKVAATLPPERFAWSIADAGVKVAALMTEEIIRRRVTIPDGATRIVLPGRCRANPEALAAHFGLPVERGPDEIVDLPAYLGPRRAHGRSLAPRPAHLLRDRRRLEDDARRRSWRRASTSPGAAPT